MSRLRELLTDLPEPDTESGAAVAARAADVLRPTGALQRLDDLAAWMAAWQATTSPAVRSPVGLLFVADHGIAAADEVSAYPTDVTAAMLAVAGQERTTLHALARQVGARVVTVDVGVGRPTGDIRHEPALSPERFDQVVGRAVATVDDVARHRKRADLLVLGEMGIGNTTVAAAVVTAALGGDPADWVGRGTGVDDDGLARKQAAVAAAVARVAGTADPLELLWEVGGAELAAMAAAIVAARHHRIPVVLDGYVVAASALVLELATPGALDHCIAGHVSAEPGHRRVLEYLGMEPLLDLGMRLGEGSGAMAAVPLVAMACRAVTEVPTFGEWFGS